jgi:uncharacterized protein YjcR
MEFNEFSMRLGLGASQLTEIGNLFGVMPNTVWNWKHRNSVPAKYILEARDRRLFKRIKKEASPWIKKPKL